MWSSENTRSEVTLEADDRMLHYTKIRCGYKYRTFFTRYLKDTFTIFQDLQNLSDDIWTLIQDVVTVVSRSQTCLEGHYFLLYGGKILGLFVFFKPNQNRFGRRSGHSDGAFLKYVRAVFSLHVGRRAPSLKWQTLHKEMPQKTVADVRRLYSSW